MLTQLSDITIILYFSLNGYSIIPHRKLSWWWWPVPFAPDPSMTTLSALHCFQPSKIELERYWLGHLLYYWWWSSYESDPRCPHNTTKTSSFQCESLCLVYCALCFISMFWLDWVLWKIVGPTQTEAQRWQPFQLGSRRATNSGNSGNSTNSEGLSDFRLLFMSDGSSVCWYTHSLWWSLDICARSQDAEEDRAVFKAVDHRSQSSL